MILRHLGASEDLPDDLGPASLGAPARPLACRFQFIDVLLEQHLLLVSFSSLGLSAVLLMNFLIRRTLT